VSLVLKELAPLVHRIILPAEAAGIVASMNLGQESVLLRKTLQNVWGYVRGVTTRARSVKTAMHAVTVVVKM